MLTTHAASRHSLAGELSPALRQRPQPQRVEPDESCGIPVIVGHLAFFEGDEVLVVERIRALAPDHADIALVELEPH